MIVDDSSTNLTRVSSLGDVGRQAVGMSTGRERLLFKEAEEMVPPDAGTVSQALV